jgi:hypothetical protein
LAQLYDVVGKESKDIFLQITNLMIPEEGPPGATAKHEGLHERSFGLFLPFGLTLFFRLFLHEEGDNLLHEIVRDQFI